MANYNKSFNFRNGVQVDSDNFIVNASGAVGIGTSIPTATLDLYGGSKLRGDVNITGLVTSTQAYVSGISTFNDVRIGTGITIEASSGIITATKFYGDGSTLDNVTSIAVSGWEINPGLAGTTSNVGIGTTNPTNTLSIKKSYEGNTTTSNDFACLNISNPKLSYDLNNIIGGVTFTKSVGNSSGIRAGILALYAESAASSAPGANLVFHTASLTAPTSTEKLRITSDGKVGIGTSVPGQPLDVIGKLRTEELEVTKTSSFTQRVGLTTSIQVGGDVNVLGISTFTGNVGFGTSALFDDNDKILLGNDADLSIYHSGSHSWIEDTGTGNLVLKASRLDIQDTDGNELLLAEGGSYVRLNYGADERFKTSGVGVTITDQIDAGTLNLDQGYIGVNTAGISTVSIGQSVGVGRSTGLLRFGSADRTFEVLNNDTGDLVFGLHSGSVAGINTGDFKWTHKTTNNLMTLTGIGGSLGINQEDPIHPLHVGGSSTITGVAWFGNNVNVKNNITCDGVITGSFTLQPVITSDVNSTGISTVGGLHIVEGASNTLGVGTYTVTSGAKVEVQGGAVFPDTGVGINTNKVDSEYALSVRGDMKVNKLTGWTKEGVDSAGVTLQHSDNDKITTTETGAVITGICTATDFEGTGATAADFPKGLTGIAVTASGNLTVGSVIANPAGVNFADAGVITKRFMVLPTVTTTQRDSLTHKVAGALVYNSSTNKLNFYTGSGWEVVTSS